MSEENEMEKRLRYRRFMIVNSHKQSQPQHLDDDDFSPRFSIDSNLGTPRALPVPQIAIQVENEEGQPIDDIEEANLTYRRSSFLTESSDAEVRSQISFIMKERLHTLAKEVQRRTSTVRDTLLRETPDDNISIVSSTIPKDEKRPSLMSLIGLQRTTEVLESVRRSKWIPLPDSIHQYGTFYMLWLAIVTAAFLYNAYCVPLRSSYPYQTKDNIVYWMIVDYFFDFIYVIDTVLIKPRLQFMRGGRSISDRGEMWKNYRTSRLFVLDLLSVVPTDICYFYFRPIAFFRINRILKINSFWALFDMLDNAVSNPYAIRIARTLSYMVYIIHCNSCIYYMLSAWQAFGQIAYLENGKYYLNKWVYNNQGNAYIRCFYFTAAVATSTGNNPAPTNVIEYIYMTFSWMMGVFVFALLLGQIRDIVSNANRNREEYQRKMDLALGECKRLNLSKDLTDRVRDWFIYTWQQQKTLDEKKLIEKLPLKLQTDLALSVHYNTLSKVQLFQDCDRALLRDLVLKLRPVIFLPGDMVCKKGDVGKEMYIVNQGVLQVVGGDNNEKVFAELTQGSVFGEISLLAIGGNNRRTASIKAKGYTTLFVLLKEDLNDVIKYYPQAQALLKKKAAQMLKNDKKSDESKVEQKGLEETCKISGLSTPKMLRIVAEVLPPEKKTTKELMDVLDKDSQDNRRSSVYHWNNTNSRESDEDSAFEGVEFESDIEFEIDSDFEENLAEKKEK
ncbi:unnamed protein product [Auanema sp. JU1783]|nr:unnamed protein product [Auanema sp. JU1783]